MPEPMTPPADAAEDASAPGGYCVTVCAHPDGTFSVSGPEPLAEEQAEKDAGEGMTDETEGDKLTTIGAALKAVMQVLKDNPVTESEQANFEAGYGG